VTELVGFGTKLVGLFAGLVAELVGLLLCLVSDLFGLLLSVPANLLALLLGLLGLLLYLGLGGSELSSGLWQLDVVLVGRGSGLGGGFRGVGLVVVAVVDLDWLWSGCLDVFKVGMLDVGSRGQDVDLVRVNRSEGWIDNQDDEIRVYSTNITVVESTRVF
jgi:hypothetical protein